MASLARLLAHVSMKVLLVLSVMVAAAAIVTGFMLDAAGFAGNLLAEVAGLLLGVLLAVLIVDVLIERERARRWDLVAAETETNLRLAMIRAGLDVYLLLPVPRPPAADPYTMSQAGPHGLSEALRALADAVRAEPSLQRDSGATGGPEPLAVVEALKPHLELIRTAVMPRLIAVGEHDLIARLAFLEGAYQELEHSAWMADRFGGWTQLAVDLGKVIDALSDVSEMTETVNT